MNRRNFFGTLAKSAAGFAILPAATTYLRTWKPAPQCRFIGTATVRFGWDPAELGECSSVMRTYFDTEAQLWIIDRTWIDKRGLEVGRVVEPCYGVSVEKADILMAPVFNPPTGMLFKHEPII